MTILMNCPKCGLPQEHYILDELYDDEGHTAGYVIKCRFCSHVWEEMLREGSET